VTVDDYRGFAVSGADCFRV